MANELTPEEKRAKRNEYARAYYAKNKDRMKAARGAKGAKPVAQKNAIKAVEKVAARGEKTAAAAKQLLKDAAEAVRAAVRTKDDETVALALESLAKRASIETFGKDGKTYLRFSVDGKSVKLPDAFAAQADGPTEEELMAIEEEADEDAPVEIAVDPADAAALQDGASEDEIMPQYDKEDGDEDDEDGWGEDEEREAGDDFGDDDFENDRASGRADMFREMEAMGVGDGEW